MRIPFALGVLASTAALLPARPAAPQEFFPPSEGLTIPASEPDGWRLDQLLAEYGRVTEQRFLYGDDTRAQLRQCRVPIGDALTIAPENLHAVVETLMIESDFVFSIAREANPRLISVHSLQSAARANLRQLALYVPVDELPSWREHPAFLVHTVLTLDSVDVRTLTNSMRALLTDANTQQIIPVGNSQSLILTGFAPQVESLVRMLRQVDASNLALLAKQPRPEPADEDGDR